MKRNILILAILALTVSLFAAEAGAGWFDKDKGKDKREAKIHRYDLFPTVSFTAGVLSRDTRTGWQLDDVNIQFLKGCQVAGKAGAPVELQEGSTALVMGPRYGNVILAYRVQIQEPDYLNLGAGGTPNVAWSTEDPTVGEGTGMNPQ